MPILKISNEVSCRIKKNLLSKLTFQKIRLEKLNIIIIDIIMETYLI